MRLLPPPCPRRKGISVKYGLFVGLAAMLFAPVAVGVSAEAEPPGARRTPVHEARLVMQPMASTGLQWKATGGGKGGAVFCASSTSGRYTLEVSSMTGQGLVGAEPLAYSIRFESDGVVQYGRISRQSPSVRFNGVVSPDRDCTSGPNVRIIISLENRDALAVNAGAYADQVNLLIEPR
jgi:hypothetical protein